MKLLRSAPSAAAGAEHARKLQQIAKGILGIRKTIHDPALALKQIDSHLPNESAFPKKYFRGLVHFAQCDFAAAVDSFSTALEEWPKSWLFHYMRSAALLLNGDCIESWCAYAIGQQSLSWPRPASSPQSNGGRLFWCARTFRLFAQSGWRR
jgi:hypothetical protein